MGVAAALATSVGLSGCEMPWGSDDDGDPSDDWPAAPVNVAGTWTYKREVMELKQSGTVLSGTTSVEGFRQNPADPIEYPVPTLGGVLPDGRIRLEEMIIYKKNPTKNFEVEKVGRLEDSETLVLEVVAGQRPHTQVWKRK